MIAPVDGATVKPTPMPQTTSETSSSGNPVVAVEKARNATPADRTVNPIPATLAVPRRLISPGRLQREGDERQQRTVWSRRRRARRCIPSTNCRCWV